MHYCKCIDTPQHCSASSVAAELQFLYWRLQPTEDFLSEVIVSATSPRRKN